MSVPSKEPLRWDEDKILRYGLLGMLLLAVLGIGMVVRGFLLAASAPPTLRVATVPAPLAPVADIQRVARTVHLPPVHGRAVRVSVEVWPAPPPYLGMKLATVVAAGDAPDVLIVTPADLKALMAPGSPPLLKDLADLAARWHVRVPRGWQQGDRVLALPWRGLAVGLYARAPLPRQGTVFLRTLLALHEPGTK